MVECDPKGSAPGIGGVNFVHHQEVDSLVKLIRKHSNAGGESCSGDRMMRDATSALHQMLDPARRRSSIVLGLMTTVSRPALRKTSPWCGCQFSHPLMCDEVTRSSARVFVGYGWVVRNPRGNRGVTPRPSRVRTHPDHGAWIAITNIPVLPAHVGRSARTSRPSATRVGRVAAYHCG